MASKSQTRRRDADSSRSAIGVAEEDPVQPASEEEIRIRAHQIFLERGVEPGDELSDWLQAERELRKRLASRSQTN